MGIPLVKLLEVWLAYQGRNAQNQRGYQLKSFHLEQTSQFAVVAFVVGGVNHDGDVGEHYAGGIELQLEQTGGSIGVEDGQFAGVGPVDAGQGVLIKMDGLDVLLGLEEDIGLLPDFL